MLKKKKYRLYTILGLLFLWNSAFASTQVFSNGLQVIVDPFPKANTVAMQLWINTSGHEPIAAVAPYAFATPSWRASLNRREMPLSSTVAPEVTNFALELSAFSFNHGSGEEILTHFLRNDNTYTSEEFSAASLAVNLPLESSSQRESLRKFLQTNYTFSNRTLIISGPITETEIIGQIFRILPGTSLLKQAKARSLVTMHEWPQAKIEKNKTNPTNAFISLSLRLPSLSSFTSAQVVALQLLEVLLKEIPSTFIAPAHADANLAEVGYHLNPAIHQESLLVIDRKLLPVAVEAGAETVLLPVVSLQNQEVDPVVLEKAKSMVNQQFSRQQTPSIRAYQLAYYHTFFRSADLYDQAHVALASMDSKTLSKEFVSWLKPNRMHVQLFAPQDTLNHLDIQTLLAPRNLPTMKAATKSETTGKQQKFILPNGIVLVVHPNISAAMTIIRAEWPGGQLSEDVTSAGINSLLANTLGSSCQNYSAAALPNVLQQFQGKITASTTADSFGVELSLPTQQNEALPLAIPIWLHCLQRPVFSPKIVQIQQANRIMKLTHPDDNGFRLLRNPLLQGLFPNHHYGLPILGGIQTLSSFTPQTLHAFYKKHYPLSGLQIHVSGNVSASVILGQLQKFIAFNHTDYPTTLPTMLPVSRAVAMTRFIPMTASQPYTYLGLGFQAPAVDSVERYALEVATSLFMRAGGAFTQWHNQYGLNTAPFGSTHHFYKQAGFLSFYSAVDTRRSEEAKTALLARLKGFTKIVPPSTELTEVKEQLLNHYALQRKNPVWALREDAQKSVWALDNFVEIYDQQISAVTAETIAQVWEKYIIPEVAVAVSMIPAKMRSYSVKTTKTRKPDSHKTKKPETNKKLNKENTSGHKKRRHP